MTARVSMAREGRFVSALLLMLAIISWPARNAASADAGLVPRTIDEHIEARLRSEEVPPGDAADDATFLRRATLDLIGRVPTPSDVRTFLDRKDPEKRARLVSALLADPRHSEHFAKTWGALLVPEAESNSQLRYFVPGLEAWLRQRREARAGFDTIVRDLLTVRIASPAEGPQVVLKDLKQANPIAFLASKGGDPASIAASSVRLFLGIRLECAQCHNHPFESWSQAQFWEQAAFFSGIERKGRSPFSPLTESIDRTSIEIMGKAERVRAKYLDGTEPELDARRSARDGFASWLTSPENPFFARAIVNRVWCQLMGEGLVEPVDDFGSNNPASHPRLLDDLAARFAKSEFDLQSLLAELCLSQAYQRSSRVTRPAQDRAQLFARRAIRPMTGEQFFSALSQAIGYEPKAGRVRAGSDEDPLRRRVLEQFSSSGLYAHPETSVSQALSLMNGTIVRNATDPRTSPTITRILNEAEWSSARQIDELFLLTLSRFPIEDERRPLVSHLEAGDTDARGERLGDVLWALLNSAEFRWNH